VPADPPDVDFVVVDDPGGADEELPESAGAPWWLRARVPLGVAAAVAFLAGLMFRLTSAGDGGDRPAGAPGAARPSANGSTSTTSFPPTLGDRIKIGPLHGTEIFEVPPCDVLPKCIVTLGAPDPVIAALKDHIPGAHVVFASTSLEATGIAGRHHRFRATSVQARRGPVKIRITILRGTSHDKRPTRGGEQETAFGTRIYARVHFDGYNVSIDVTGPTGRVRERADDILSLATDARLRPGH
jgi:hypothetical protein